MAIIGHAFDAREWAAPGLLLLIWASFEALTEQTSEVPSLYAPWAARGPLTRLAGRVLYPGWATGLVFTLVMLILVSCAEMMFVPQPRNEELQPLIMGLIYSFTMIAPVPVLLLMPGAKHRGAIYFLVHLICGLLFVVTRVMNGSRDSATAFVDSLTPTTATMALMGGLSTSDDHWPFFTILTLPIGGCITLFLLIKARKEFRLIREMEGRALAPESSALPSDA